MTKRNPSRPRRRHVLAALAISGACGLALPQLARAGNVWDGGGGNNNWTNGNNWNDNDPPINNGMFGIVMDGTVRPSPNVDVPYDIHALIFNFNATDFNLSGQQLTIGAGGILQGDAGAQRINNRIRIATSQTWETLSGPLAVGDGGNNGTVNLGGIVPHTLTVAGSFQTGFNGRIEGFGTLRKVSPGVLSVLSMAGSAANTYVGATVVERGTLYLSKPDGVVAVPTNLTIGDGVGTATVLFGANNQIVDTASVTLNNFGVLDLNVRNETIANLTINGGLVKTSGETFRVNGSFALNSGTYLASGQTLRAGSMQVGFNGNGRFIHRAGFFSNVSCFGDLRVGNGTSGSGQYDLHLGELAVVGTTSIGGAGTGRYVQTAGLAFLQYVVNDGSMQISGGQFTANALDGAGSLSVTGTGMLNVARIRQGGGLTVSGTNSRVRIVPNGTTLALSRVGALNLGSPGAITGWLDLSNNFLIVDYTGASPLPTVGQYIASGYNAGAWDGSGINTSRGNASTFGIGYVEASDLFTTFPTTYFGHGVDSSTLLVAFTRYGDANLDRVVNLDDFNRLAANFGSTSATWAQGDFTYDGRVNLDDFNRLAGNFGLSAAGAHVTPQEWFQLASAVPEPTTLGVVAALACARGSRRRRRS
jgi:hypothetical protein